MKDNQILVGAVDVQTVFDESWQDHTKGEEQGKGFALAIGYDSTGRTSLLVRLKHYSPPDGELIQIALHKLDLDANGYADINDYYEMAEAIVDCKNYFEMGNEPLSREYEALKDYGYVETGVLRRITTIQDLVTLLSENSIFGLSEMSAALHEAADRAKRVTEYLDGILNFARENHLA